MGAVVTASGTGAEMNAGAVITCEEKKCGRDRFLVPQRHLRFSILLIP